MLDSGPRAGLGTDVRIVAGRRHIVIVREGCRRQPEKEKRKNNKTATNAGAGESFHGSNLDTAVRLVHGGGIMKGTKSVRMPRARTCLSISGTPRVWLDFAKTSYSRTRCRKCKVIEPTANVRGVAG